MTLNTRLMILALALVLLGGTACQPRSDRISRSSTPAPNIAPSPTSPLFSGDRQMTPDPEIAVAKRGTYKSPNGMFEITLPQDYSYQTRDEGIVFISNTGKLGGYVDVRSVKGDRLTTAQLEAFVKQDYAQTLDQVAWQGVELQADGSIRIDWIGRDKDGNDLDASTFIEQQGDHVLTLAIYAINASYDDYRGDIKTVLQNYVVRKNGRR